MTAGSKVSIETAMEAAALKAGLEVLSTRQGKDFHGAPTAVFVLGLPGVAGKSLKLELTSDFDFTTPQLEPQMIEHLAAQGKRLRNPHPEYAVTLAGLPVAFGQFLWPFHRSTTGADTYIVHGELHLANGGPNNLHARVAASVTLTFAEIVPAMEQPYAEAFVYNAVRKTVDLGQLEFLKSGNRQPVPVTTRYFSRWQNKFIFTDTDDQERLRYLLSKVYWLSGALGGNEPVWIADPRDAQYLNTTVEDLKRMAADEAALGLMKLDGEFAAATPALLARDGEYQAALEKALDFTKPKFNDSMRAGEANM